MFDQPTSLPRRMIGVDLVNNSCDKISCQVCDIYYEKGSDALSLRNAQIYSFGSSLFRTSS
jgi:hypothetical protein